MRGHGAFICGRIVPLNNSINLKIGRIAEKIAVATNSCHIVGRVQLDKSVYYCYQNQTEVSNMNKNQLAENLMYYRKKKGLSQEKVSEYLEVSRQAVTKWEANFSCSRNCDKMKKRK